MTGSYFLNYKLKIKSIIFIISILIKELELFNDFNFLTKLSMILQNNEYS